MSGEVAIYNAVKDVIPSGSLRPAIDTLQFRIGILIKVPYGFANCSEDVDVMRRKR